MGGNRFLNHITLAFFEPSDRIQQATDCCKHDQTVAHNSHSPSFRLHLQVWPGDILNRPVSNDYQPNQYVNANDNSSREERTKA